MQTIEKITTEYVQSEDRIRLSGKSGDAVVVIWVTQRLCNRLLPVMIKWIENQDVKSSKPEVVREFKQQAARAQMPRQKPVQGKPESKAWLSTKVDVKQNDKLISLTFLNDSSQAGISLNATQLRQWLMILCEAYRKAGWPLDSWPKWIASSNNDSPKSRAALH